MGPGPNSGYNPNLNPNNQGLPHSRDPVNVSNFIMQQLARVYRPGDAGYEQAMSEILRKLSLSHPSESGGFHPIHPSDGNSDNGSRLFSNTPSFQNTGNSQS